MTIRAIPATPIAPIVENIYGIGPRKGWMALNFFYNTGIDANNALYFNGTVMTPRRLCFAARTLADLVVRLLSLP